MAIVSVIEKHGTDMKHLSLIVEYCISYIEHNNNWSRKTMHKYTEAMLYKKHDACNN
jgi:hypothetical protein